MKIKHTLYIILLTASLIPLYIFASVMIVQNNKNTKKVPIYRHFLHIRLYQGLIRDLKILDIIKNQ